jgi:hypothetical protein
MYVSSRVLIILRRVPLANHMLQHLIRHLRIAFAGAHFCHVVCVANWPRYGSYSQARMVQLVLSS